MLITNLKEKDKSLLKTLLEEFVSNYFEVRVGSVCTSDGFSLGFVSKKDDGIEADKIAAVASTLCSISNAAAEEVSNSVLKLTTIESDNGRNIILMKTSFFEIDCVVCVEASNKMSLAELRFVSADFAKKIKTLHLGF